MSELAQLTRTLTFTGAPPLRAVETEWLVTNGLGGYASGTVSGIMSRRYHGLLIAALASPHGRVVMLTHMGERLRLPDGRVFWLNAEERHDAGPEWRGLAHIEEFRLRAGLPVWRYRFETFQIEKSLVLPHGQNTVLVTYRVLEGDGTLRLGLRPGLSGRPHDAPVSDTLPERPRIMAEGTRVSIELSPGLPELRLRALGQRRAFTLDPLVVEDLVYRVERSRGYDSQGDAWSPGYIRLDLSIHSPATFVASTESWEILEALGPGEALTSELTRRERLITGAGCEPGDAVATELVLAADQFVITPAGRAEDAARARAAGNEARTVIAGYHWFTDWGRDTMISLEGLTLTTGRHEEARYILRTFGQYFRDGLIPNLFPEGDREGLYHTADATLWFFHALDRYLEVTGDTPTLQALLPALRDSVERHIAGTRFNIGVDPADGLLRQGVADLPLTWMDAKVGDWVVTPRRGKPVEINGLWYNALMLLADWLEASGEARDASAFRGRAATARASFNARFWYEAGGHLYDVIDGEAGDDPACRPNQLLAFSLKHPVLESSRWAQVLDVVQERLVTPVGLRSLDPSHPSFSRAYDGDLRARDAAYHQGTVWAWLIGPFIDAWLKVHPGDHEAARRFLDGFVPHLSEACVGSISEVFDATEPYHPRGCIAQAWSVAEVLRCWRKTGAGRG